MISERQPSAKVLILLLLTAIAISSATPVVHRVSATHDPTDFTINALFSGWNSTLAPGTFSACSPTGTSSCNPPVTEFRGVAFTVKIVWKDLSHNFAIYTKNTLPTGVNSLQTCSPPGTNGCWAKSATVSSANVPLTFTPTVPPDDFTGDGGYEYYCQFHPNSMHGKITVSKSPDLNGDGTVTIVDIATMATAFGSTRGPPPSANWNVAADIDNDGDVDIVDIAKAAVYFGKTL